MAPCSDGEGEWLVHIRLSLTLAEERPVLGGLQSDVMWC